MSTVAVESTVDGARIRTVLGPAGTAVLTGAAPVVMVDHDPVSDLGLADSHGLTDQLDDSAGLMTLNDELRSGAMRAVEVMEVAAAHPRGLHPDDHFVRAGHRVGVLADLEFAFAQENDGFHMINAPRIGVVGAAGDEARSGRRDRPGRSAAQASSSGNAQLGHASVRACSGRCSASSARCTSASAEVSTRMTRLSTLTRR